MLLENDPNIRCIQQFHGHAKLDTTQIYTQVSIQQFKQVHTLTHPAKMKADMVDDNTDAEFTWIDNICMFSSSYRRPLMHKFLTDRLDDYMREKVATGLYNNASEVIREALRLKIAAEETDELKLQKLRDAIDPALQQAERGECVPFDMDAILTELDQEMAANA